MLLVATTLAAVACSDGAGPSGAAIRPELIRLNGSPAAAALPSASAATAAGSSASGYDWSSALTLTSFRSPIRAIYLRGDDSSGGATIYECAAGTNDGCLVELAGPALEDLLGADPVTIRSGTYTTIEIHTCFDEGEYQAYVTASVALGGTTYRTSAALVLDTAATAEAVRVNYSGCARAYPLPAPLVVTDTAGAPIVFRLYFDIRDLAWASLGGLETAAGWIPGGCTGPRPGAPETGGTPRPFLCTGYPDVAGTVGDSLPTVERYRINGGATIGLLFTRDGGFVGGFSRRYFEEGSASTAGFNADTPVSDWVDHGDGTYRLATFGGHGPGGTPVGHYLDMPEFRRADHSGTATRWDAQVFAYTALRLE